MKINDIEYIFKKYSLTVDRIASKEFKEIINIMNRYKREADIIYEVCNDNNKGKIQASFNEKAYAREMKNHESYIYIDLLETIKKLIQPNEKKLALVFILNFGIYKSKVNSAILGINNNLFKSIPSLHQGQSSIIKEISSLLNIPEYRILDDLVSRGISDEIHDDYNEYGREIEYDFDDYEVPDYNDPEYDWTIKTLLNIF